MRKPNFIIAGFPKCGTTSLYHYLSEHPQVFLPNQKELHFFTHKNISKLNQGPKDKIVKQTQIKTSCEYLSFYKSVKKEIAIGDASPSYINYPSEFPKIKDYLGDPKVIIILRDPINRSFSNYLHLKREYREHLSFFEAIRCEEERKKSMYSDFWYYKFNSTYYQKILRAKETFTNVLVLTLEELNETPNKSMKKVYNFLGVDENLKLKSLSNKFNVGGSFKQNFFTKLIFQPSGFKNKIKKIIKPSPFIKSILMKISTLFASDKENIDEQSINNLKEYFRKDVHMLKSINVDVSKWRKY